MSEFAEDDVEKVSTPPLVHDATLPSATSDDDAGPKTGVLIAVVGALPSAPSVPVYDPALGYCVWQTTTSVGAAGPMLIRDEVTGTLGALLDDAGDPIYAFPE